MSNDIQRIIRLDVNASQALAQLDKISRATGAMEKSTQQAAVSLGKVGGAVETAMNFGKGLLAFEVIKTAIGGIIDGFTRMSESMDQVGKTASGLGITTEELTKLQYAADLAGVNSEQLTAGLSRLNDKIADVGKGTDKASQMLRHFGVEAGDSTQKAMEKIADAFARSADGPAKTSAAIELFGRMLGIKMIPLLNGGAKGLKEMGDEAQKFGLVLSGDAAKKAEVFNDNMRRLGLQFTALGRAITADLLPQMNTLLQNLLDNIQKFGLLRGAVLGLWETIRKKPTDDATGALVFNTQALEKAERELAAVRGSNNQITLKHLEGNVSRLRLQNEAMKETVRLARRADDATKTVMGSMTVAAAKVKPVGPSLENMPKVLEKGAKAAKEAKTEMERFWESLDKAAEVAENINPKIEALEREMKKLEAAGQRGSELWFVYSDALAKLRDAAPDTIALGIKKIADAAAELENAPETVDRMEKRMAALSRAGLESSEQFRLLRDEVLKAKAISDPYAQITLDLEKMTKATEYAEQHFEALLVMFGRGDINAEQFTELTRKLEVSGQKADEVGKKVKTLSESVAEAGAKFITDFADTLIDSLGKAETSFSSLVESMLKQIAKLMLNQYFVQFLKLSEGSGGWAGAIAGFFKTAAHGAAFDKGVQYMGSGGVVHQPTMFAHGGGLGVMGEAGAEAIVPLKRDAAGDLGVKASPTVININNHNDSNVSVSQRTNTDGAKEIDILIERKVRTMIAGGKLDSTMRSAYGMSRQPAIG